MSPILLAGIDEAGRGPLVGDVFAAVAILPERYDLPGLTDSRELNEKKCDTLAVSIKEQTVSWNIASALPEEIAELNILHATILAMTHAAQGPVVVPDKVLVGGDRVPKDLGVPAEAVVKDDNKIIEISTASVLAKTARGAKMYALAERCPQYDFDKYKDYGTTQHLAALQKYGVLPEHRRDFAPVKALLKRGRLFG